MKIVLFLVILLIFLNDRLFAGIERPAMGDPQNQIDFKHISVEDGLSHSVVYTILQDSYGFIWFGSADGLDQYDGYRFISYRHIPGDSGSISDNQVRVVYEDRGKNIWVGTSKGLNLLMSDSGADTLQPACRFRRYLHNPDSSSSLSDNDIYVIYQDSRGIIWIGTANGLNKLLPGHLNALLENSHTGVTGSSTTPDRFIPYTHDPENPNSIGKGRISAIVEDSTAAGDYFLWIGTIGGGLCRFDPRTESFQRFQNDPVNPATLSSNYVMTLFRDPNDNLWIGTYGGGLCRMIINNEKGGNIGFVRYSHDPENPHSLSEDRVYSIVEDDRGDLWIGTFGGGINKFLIHHGISVSQGLPEPQNARFFRYQYKPGDPSGLSNNFVRKLYRDRSGNMWAATNNGINKWDLKPGKFNHYKYDPRGIGSSEDRVLSILEDRNEILWLGTNEGLSRLDRQSGAHTHYQVDHHNPRSGSGFVYAIEEDRSGRLWIGAFGGGLYHFNRKNGTYIQYRHDENDPSSISDNRVIALHEDRRGNFWIGTAHGLNLMDRQTATFHAFYSDGSDSTLTSSRLTALYEDRAGFLWIGTTDGLNRFDPVTKELLQYSSHSRVERSLSHQTVNAFWEDASFPGVLWIGTDNGLNRLVVKTGMIKHFFERDGLPSSFITGILGDDRGYIWISTSRGLSRYNAHAPPERRRFRNFDEGDGLQSNEFIPGSYFRSPGGEMFFGGINGFNCFYPGQVRDNPYPPPVAFTAFKKFDRLAATGRMLMQAEEIELSYADRFFSFEFAALDFTHPEKNQYTYKMDGFDEHWIYSGTRNYASYTNLDAGEYVFRVKASNNDGVWNEEGISIPVIIKPPYWATWWFRGLVVAAIGAVLGLMYRYRVNRLLEIERMRVRIASDLHDDVGSTLTKISLYSDLIRSGAEASDKENLLQKIGAMSRDLVTTMSDIVWSIDARNDTAGDLLDRMRDFAAGALSPRQMNVTFEVEGLDPEKKLPVDIRQNLYLVFKEAVNNAARHSGAKRVTVNLHNRGGKMILRVSDNGQGINISQKPTGHGLRNMRMRAERIGGRLEVRNVEGTTVILTRKAV